jgi:exopolysaccharide production repressor protein
MSLPIFVRGLIILLLIFAVFTYLIVGSAWTTFIDTVVCAVLVQLGYFAVVLFMVCRTPRVEPVSPATSIALPEQAGVFGSP